MTPGDAIFEKIRASSGKRQNNAASLMKGRIIQAIMDIPAKDRDMRAVVEKVLDVVRRTK